MALKQGGIAALDRLLGAHMARWQSAATLAEREQGKQDAARLKREISKLYSTEENNVSDR